MTGENHIALRETCFAAT